MKLTPWEPDLRTLIDRIDREDIDLQPDFQRQEVWSTAKKRKLIDTILRSWSIPPVHLVETADKKLEVLDGQQRLAAIRDFIHGQFSIDGRITPADAGISSLHRLFYKKLPDTVRRQVDNYTLRCFRITDYSPEEPSELFYRLNQPTMLTAGEQRNALYGDSRSQLKNLVAAFVTQGNDRPTLGFSNARLSYDDILARLLFFLELGSFGLKSTESRISERFRQGDAFPDAVIGRAERAVQLFSVFRADSGITRFNKASVLSWLMFFSRFDGVEPQGNPIVTYHDALDAKFTAHYATEAALLFNDRASLRVTDVSSVVYRDFVLWYLYYFLVSEEVPRGVLSDVIVEVEDVLSERDDVTFEFTLGELLDIDAWSGSL